MAYQVSKTTHQTLRGASVYRRCLFSVIEGSDFYQRIGDRHGHVEQYIKIGRGH